MDLFWAVLIIVTTVFFLFVVLPSLLSPNVVSVYPRQYAQPKHHIQGQQYDHTETSCEKTARESKAMLDTYYRDAPPNVPEDYPRKMIGACPYSKPPATDLPVVNTPMCITVREQRKLKDMA